MNTAKIPVFTSFDFIICVLYVNVETTKKIKLLICFTRIFFRQKQMKNKNHSQFRNIPGKIIIFLVDISPNCFHDKKGLY